MGNYMVILAEQLKLFHIMMFMLHNIWNNKQTQKKRYSIGNVRIIFSFPKTLKKLSRNIQSDC